MEKKAKYPLDIGEMCGVKALVLVSPKAEASPAAGNNEYILCEGEMGAADAYASKGANVQRVNDVYFQDTWDKSKWFIFYVADCFCPPLYLIRANSWEDAYEAFCDEFSDAIDTEAVQGFEVKLSRVYC